MAKTIIKADGTSEPFSQTKVTVSLEKAGISEVVIDAIVARLENTKEVTLTSSDIHAIVMDELNQAKQPAGKYNLKRALMDLGPTGYPFERYIAELFRAKGYIVEVGVSLLGRCVGHEIDISARKGSEHILGECKFHNMRGAKTDIQVALYTYARFQDVLANGKHSSLEHTPWLITNTRCTSDAIAYAKCIGIKILSWGYPEAENLQGYIEQPKLYPVTCLSSISETQKALLLKNEIILAAAVDQRVGRDLLGLRGERLDELLREVEYFK